MSDASSNEIRKPPRRYPAPPDDKDRFLPGVLAALTTWLLIGIFVVFPFISAGSKLKGEAAAAGMGLVALALVAIPIFLVGGLIYSAFRGFVPAVGYFIANVVGIIALIMLFALLAHVM